MEVIPDGVSTTVTSNRPLQWLLYYFLKGYLKTFHFIATKYYVESQNEFFNMHHISVPSLLLVSECDPIGSADVNRSVAECWKSRGIPVRVKVWNDSPHVGHYLKHREEYEQELSQILDYKENF